ncbi:MAG: hypothetical protein QM697_04170 [Lachnospiraceae bacterium]
MTDQHLQNRNYKKWISAFALFLAFMWICTIVSKSIYVSRLPMVQAQTPEKKFVEHLVEAEGLVIEGGKQAVTVLEGLRVKNILVKKGDRIEEGMPLFEIDTEDLTEIIKEKETAIAKLNYQISDLQANRVLQEQKDQLLQQRAMEDYAAADSKTGTQASRAAGAKNTAETALQDHLNHPAQVTSEEERQRAWDAYHSWLSRKYELTDKITERERVIANIEAIEGTKTEEEKAILEEAKKELIALQDELTNHERNSVTEPDFSGEDSALSTWKQEKENLQESVQSAGIKKEDADTDRSSALKQEQRDIQDTLLPGQADSTLSVCQLELETAQEDLARYQQIMDEKGIMIAGAGGAVTDILIAAGERTTDTAAMLLTDDTVPCQFKVILTKDQKKYVNIGDTAEIKLGGNRTGIEAKVEYLTESTGSTGGYEILLGLPSEEVSPGISGTMTVSVQGESQNLCIPSEALYKVDERYYVYVVKEKEGILGKELYAEKVSVRVNDQNDRFAAVEEGSLDKESQVIISSSDELKRGDIVRYEE